MNLKKIAGNVASNFAAASMGSANEQYLNSLSPMEKAKILKAIAAHYGVSVREMEDEVTDREAEALYEYLSFNNGMAMKVYRDFKSQRIASEMTAGCEKLPEGPMRENCEKKKGEKKEAGEVPEAFKKEWKNDDKDGDGKENEPKPDFLKDKKSSVADRVAQKLIQGGCEKLPEALRENCEKKKKEGKKSSEKVAAGDIEKHLQDLERGIKKTMPSLGLFHKALRDRDYGFDADKIWLQISGPLLDALEAVESLQKSHWR